MVGLPMIDTVHNVVYRILYIVKILNKMIVYAQDKKHCLPAIRNIVQVTHKQNEQKDYKTILDYYNTCNKPKLCTLSVILTHL